MARSTSGWLASRLASGTNLMNGPDELVNGLTLLFRASAK